MKVQENVALAGYTTFGVGGAARYFVRAESEPEIAEAVAWAREARLPLFVLGGGSNLLVPDEGFAGLVLRMEIGGVQQAGAHFDVGAGVVWDEFVNAAIAAYCAGVECMAGIPGSTGGTPVQNVGAYGQEVAETIESVRAFDREHGAFVDLSKYECDFRYRQSRFNTEEPGRFIVTRVRFALRPGGAPTLKYAELAKRFESAAGLLVRPSLAEVAAAVREIRRAKGMLIVAGDADCRSAGSFFRNPVVAAEDVAQIAAAAGVMEDMVPMFPAPNGAAGGRRVKLPAAWLLERAGFVKGYGEGAVGISSRHTLALVNRSGATFAEVLRFEREIEQVVEAKFGVRLEREPVVMR